MSLGDAAILIGIGVTIGGFLVGIWDRLIAQRDRRSSQRQYVYEQQSQAVNEFLEYALEQWADAAYLHIVLEQVSISKNVVVDQYASFIRTFQTGAGEDGINTISRRWKTQMRCATYLPNGVFDTVMELSQLIGSLGGVLTDSNYDHLKDNLTKYSKLEAQVSSKYRELIGEIRKLLKIEVLITDMDMLTKQRDGVKIPHSSSTDIILSKPKAG